ncbi:ABC transporter substrate-binding protein [Brenneria tiliae]|uniref:ABC transporter substrate-binding protein n=1 Tax=Brenneria tiliae TaxID=2914984 RepID=UPI002014ED30|nr:ABC transporter substrate-binding protein [Brenneria tiliae]MCL2896553.1 ABC transporter substrate-binding protein [Brenneria tiliae]MCL2901197.1 ABC transporter substrate-binding protein [Brenneria tiliae]
MNFPRRDFNRLSGAILAAAILACGLVGGLSLPALAQSAEIQRGGALKIAFRSDNTALVSIDPFQVYWIEHRSVLRAVVDQLTDQDPQSGEIIPWLATRWELNNDATQYTFYLRDDVTFSNGEKFNAEAVKLSFDSNIALLKELPTAFGKSYIDGYVSSEVVDEYTIKVNFSVPNAAFLQATSTTNLGILAPATYKNSTIRERNLGKIIGSGPFILAEYSPEERIVLKKREGYAWPSAASENKGDAYLDEIIVRYIPESGNRVGSVIAGEVDIAWPRDPFTNEDYNYIKGKGLNIIQRSIPGITESLYPNVNYDRPFSNAAVRQAFQKAIDRKSYAATIYGQHFPVAEGVVEPSTLYYQSQADGLTHDPQGAAQLLEKAGWLVADDGYRYRDGKRLTVVYPITEEKPGDVLVQDQVRQVGFELILQPVTAGEANARYVSGNYDLQRGVLTRGDPAVIQSHSDVRYSGSAVSKNRFTAQAQLKLQELLDQGLAEADPAARRTIYQDAQDFILQENAYFPIFARTQQAAVGSRVHGVKFSGETFLHVNDIWIEK